MWIIFFADIGCTFVITIQCSELHGDIDVNAVTSIITIDVIADHKTVTSRAPSCFSTQDLTFKVYENVAGFVIGNVLPELEVNSCHHYQWKESGR